MKTGIVTQETLHELLHYNEALGALYWRKQPACGPTVDPDSPAGYVDNYGYRKIRIDGKLYLAHRLIWLYVHGTWPTNEIDHIDRNPLNNHLFNLRDVPRSVNESNKSCTSKSGHPGVTRLDSGRFHACIWKCGKLCHLGTFDTAEAAAAAFRNAHIEIYGRNSQYYPESLLAA